MDPPEGMTAQSMLNAFRSGTFSVPVCLSSAWRPRNRHTAGDWEGHPKVGVTITREPFGLKPYYPSRPAGAAGPAGSLSARTSRPRAGGTPDGTAAHTQRGSTVTPPALPGPLQAGR